MADIKKFSPFTRIKPYGKPPKKYKGAKRAEQSSQPDFISKSITHLPKTIVLPGNINIKVKPIKQKRVKNYTI